MKELPLEKQLQIMDLLRRRIPCTRHTKTTSFSSGKEHGSGL